MTSVLTPQINKENVSNIRQQIERKMCPEPFYATIPETTGAITDFDCFPYKRWFRGDYASDKPIVAEREAGLRQRKDYCYTLNKVKDYDTFVYPNHCFENACSTVHPCYPKYLSKFSDRDAMNVTTNKGCIVQYR